MEIVELLFSTRLAADLAVGVLLKGSILLATAWAVTRLMRSRPAAERHVVWTVAFALVLAMPFAGALMPQRSLGLLEYPRALISFDVAGPTSPVASAWTPTRSGGPSADASFSADAGESAWSGSVPAAPAGRAPADPGRWSLERRSGSPPVAPTVRSWWERVEAPAAAAFLLLWWIGLVGFSVRIVGHWIRAGLITARGRTVPADEAPARVARVEAERLGIRRPVKVVYSDRLGIPVTWGAVRPVVILPSEASEWPGERLRTVVLHELAHIRRWDFLSHQLAELARAFYWANPLLWIAGRAAARERERACDEAVLRDGVGSATYAGVLLDMARSYAGLPTRTPPGVEGGLAMGRPAGLRERVTDILDTPRPSRRASRFVALAAGVVVAGVAAPLASVSLLASPPGTGTFTEIVAALEHQDPDVRLRAVRNLGRWCGVESQDHVAGVLRGDPDPRVRFNAAYALGEHGFVAALDPLKAALDDEAEEPRVRFMALDMLGELDSWGAARAVLPYLEHDEPALRLMAVKSLSKMENQEAWVRPRLGRVLLHDEDERARSAAVAALSDDDCTSAVAWLQRARDDASPEVRARVQAALERFGVA